MDFSVATVRNIADPSLWETVSPVSQPQRGASHASGVLPGPMADMRWGNSMGNDALAQLWEQLTEQPWRLFKTILQQPKVLCFLRAQHMLEAHERPGAWARNERLSAEQLANVQKMISRAGDELPQLVQTAANLYAEKRAAALGRFAAGGHPRGWQFAAWAGGLEDLIYFGLQAMAAMCSSSSSSNAAEAALYSLIHSPIAFPLHCTPGPYAQLLEYVALGQHPLLQAARGELLEAAEEPDWQQQEATREGILSKLYHNLGHLLGGSSSRDNPLHEALEAFGVFRVAYASHDYCSHVRISEVPICKSFIELMYERREHGDGKGGSFFTWLYRESWCWEMLMDQEDKAVAEQPWLARLERLFPEGAAPVLRDIPLSVWCHQNLTDRTTGRAANRRADLAAAQEWSSEFDWVQAKAALQPVEPEWGSLRAAVERAARALL